jgi:hypothetical protein
MDPGFRRDGAEKMMPAARAAAGIATVRRDAFV